MSSTAQQDQGLTAAANEIRAAVLGDRKSTREIAEGFQCHERTVTNIVDRYNVPYVRFLGKRYVLLTDFRAALAHQERNAPPRGRGRPAKVQRAAATA